MIKMICPICNKEMKRYEENDYIIFKCLNCNHSISIPKFRKRMYAEIFKEIWNDIYH